MLDAVTPDHYTRFRVTFELADLTSRLPHPLASALEYILRAPYKWNEIEDLKKARWWISFFLRKTQFGIKSDDADVLWVDHDENLILIFNALASKTKKLHEMFPKGVYHIQKIHIKKILSDLDKRIADLEEIKNVEVPNTISHDTAMQEGEE